MIRILIPVYNEELNIERCVVEIHRVFLKLPHKFYLVNDGSRDGTEKIIVRLERSLPIVQLMHQENLGVAGAFKTGLSRIVRDAGDRDLVVVMEADGTSTPQLLTEMITRIESGFDIVIASRYGPRGRYVRFPLRRVILSRSANWLLGRFFGFPGVRDYTIFYRMYRASLLKRVADKFGEDLLKTGLYTANTELLVKCMEFQPRVTEVGFVYDYSKKRGPSNYKFFLINCH